MSKNSIRHIPNIITLIRLALTIIFIWLMQRDEMVIALILFVVISITDIFDGITARALGVCTRLGACLDVVSDLFFVMTSLVMLNILGLAPFWFTGVTTLKFLEFAITSSMMKKYSKHDNTWVYDSLGRCYGVLIFLAPGVFCFAAILPSISQPLTIVLLVLSCAFAIVSSTARITQCIRHKMSKSYYSQNPKTYHATSSNRIA